MLQVNKVHFAKITDLMEQKFSVVVAISERLIHTAYSHRLTAGALHHEPQLEISVNYVNEIAAKSEMFSFVNEPFFFMWKVLTFINHKKTFLCSSCWSHPTT